jgi:hypothetical protein
MEQLTTEEIYDLFKNNTNLDPEFKGLILTRVNAMFQAMYNSVSDRKNETMQMVNTHGDVWQEEHNRFVTEYQRYHL